MIRNPITALILAAIVCFAAFLQNDALKVRYSNGGDDYQEFSDTYHFHDYKQFFNPTFKTVNTLKNSAFQPLQRMLFFFFSEFFRDRIGALMAVIYALHLVNIVLVFLMVRGLLSDGPAALWAALVFSMHNSTFAVTRYLSNGVHVIQMTSVLGLYFVYRAYSRTHNKWVYTLMILWYAAALFFKETAVYAVVLIVAVDFFYDIRPEGRLIDKIGLSLRRMHRYYPFLVISLFYFWINNVFMRPGSDHDYWRQGDTGDWRWIIPRLLDYVCYALWPVRSNVDIAWIKIIISYAVLIGFFLAVFSKSKHWGFCATYSVISLVLASMYLCPPIEENTRRFYPTLVVISMVPAILWKNHARHVLSVRGWPLWIMGAYLLFFLQVSITRSGAFR